VARYDLPELRILIADDHELVRRGVRTLLEGEAGWKVVAEVRDGQEAVDKATELKPEVAILDIGMPRLNGLDAARRIKKAVPQIKVLILTMHDSEHLAWEVLKAGARGYVTKSDTARDLVLAIEALRRDKTFFTPRVDRIILDNFLQGKFGKNGKEQNGERLTSRQREIVQLLAEGKSSKEVSVLLNLSVKTIETHRANIMKRLGCHSVSDLVRYAVRNNIIHA
jgi:DNA-binding NarL/FixJ family response regulator